ncbi:TPA: DUF4238 domain-containing protein [Vibrio vulnificus]|nr:DUF4238 domain-containing protein [Vibrio vulnificus]POB21527.1 DUF4238 domain-containing protein [Vibrio vulnificus]RAH20594.1 DUF4238 domain-containing protein [Vibrio vulnificus]HAS8133524.1 DUF4238 domain-containing protein [Vibrio vulnificus]HAS8232688.1 DUF4238 domain-containing protein [Vibrio vulnificus]
MLSINGGFMAQKTDQHLVPACYLRSFLADISDLQKSNPKMKSGVFVSSKTLDSGWKMRGVNHTTFTANKYYNLPEDDENEPMIENFLSTVESSYRKYLTKVENRELTNDVMSFLSYFVMLQHIRVDRFISSMQGTWDDIAKYCDEITGENNYKKLLADVVKRQIPTIDLGDIAHQNARVIYNHTKFKFVTSDNPVIRKDVNKNDLSCIFPKELIRRDVPESYESVLFFFPLTPSIAYISCDLIISENLVYFSDYHLREIFYLNYYSILNADEKVYSSIAEPMKGEAELSKHLKGLKSKGQYIKVYTELYRLKLHGELIETDRKILWFKCDHTNELSKLTKGEKVSLVEVISDGKSIVGKRYCSIMEIDSVSGLIAFKSDFKLRI